VRGTAFDDTYDATGFGTMSLNAGSRQQNNAFEGMGGNDSITGNGLTQAQYTNALGGVTVELDHPTSGVPGSTGIAYGTDPGDVAQVGIDTFFGVYGVRGSNFGDFLHGSNGNDGFVGGGGDDFIDGRGGTDLANYGPAFDAPTGGVDIHLASGTVTGDGTDTLRSIERVRGTNFDDVYDARDFGSAPYLDPDTSNVGSDGANNEFEGMGGNDTIYGNGATRLVYINATDGVTVDLAAGTASGNASVGNDTIHGGVARLDGSNFDDTLSGSAASETIDGVRGNDRIAGGGGNDLLIGGLFDPAGDDTFVFATGDGADTIQDFTAGAGSVDKIDLTGVAGIHSLDDVLAIATQDGAATLIDFGGGDSLSLVNVVRETLSADDFVFA